MVCNSCECEVLRILAKLKRRYRRILCPECYERAAKEINDLETWIMEMMAERVM